jgi:pyruvate dehydrogenase E2 component (dihydrolipoamide acetyltransferase)
MSVFTLPDLGEGLQEAEIVSWHVSPGDQVVVDQPLVSVETDKAIVEIPSPQAGRISKVHGNVGDMIKLGAPLAEFEDAGPAQDAGTVVGEIAVGKEVVREAPATVTPTAAGVKATPAVRALAHRLNVDLSIVTPSGPDGLITVADVQRVARVMSEVEPLEPLRGVRRAMAGHMALAHAEVVPVTIMDDADVHDWPVGTDITVRLIRALAVACRAEPALNSWYDPQAVGRRLRKTIDLGIAMDTPDGLFVPVLRDAANRSDMELRHEVDRLRAGVKARRLLPEELRGYTITLSNFGMIAGKYASPVVLPPTVAILGAGRRFRAPVAVGDTIEVHELIPLSLTFDHRAVTGGEAGRFLAAVIADLQRGADDLGATS